MTRVMACNLFPVGTFSAVAIGGSCGSGSKNRCESRCFVLHCNLRGPSGANRDLAAKKYTPHFVRHGQSIADLGYTAA